MKKISIAIIFLLLGLSGGIVIGVVVDVDTVYQTTIERLKQKNSPGGEIVIDVDTIIEPGKSKKQLRKEKRGARKEEREVKKAIRKSVG